MALTHDHTTELPDGEQVEKAAPQSPRSRRALDTKIIRKVATAILLGVLTYFVVGITIVDQNQIVVGLLVGGIALIVQFMVDIEHRLRDLERRQTSYSDEMRLQIEQEFKKVNNATELFWAAAKSDLQTNEVLQLLRQATRSEHDMAPLISSFAHLQLKQIFQLLKELGEGGSVFCDGEDREWMLGFTRKTQRTIDATSLSTVDAGGSSFGDGLWASDLGQRYLELQRLAVENREVRIRRIFIILDGHGEASDEAFQRIYRQHQEHGIKARVLEQSEIGDEFRPLLYDFVVFDGEVSYEVTPASVMDPAGPSIVKTQLILNPQQVSERTERFDRLWESAREIS